ncbi:MAG TPA: YafY family protein [Streptosporangiaceae bacterium]|nr:YafY family protein [Streptosporangiaceae bacterium]
MLDTSARLLRLLALLQARPEWTGAELAARLDVTTRTLRRDVQRLRDLDYPVDSVPGPGGGYRLGAGGTLPPLLLDDDEATAVVVGLRAAATHAVAGLPEASVRALAKLDQVLPSRLRERTAALAHATVPLPGPAGGVDQALLTALARACRGHQRLNFGYRDHGGAASARAVEPHRLVSTGYRWYLMAFDTERDEWRTFRVDRIGGVTTGGRFAPRDAPDPGAFVAAAVTTAPYRYQARILVHAPLREVSERVTPASGMLQDAGSGRCLLTTGADSLAAMMFHFADLGAEFTVLEPPELVEYLRDVGGRLLRAAGAQS